MPTISWFYGIAIRMYFKDHPPPHFEAVYGEHEASVSIASGAVKWRRPPNLRGSPRSEPSCPACGANRYSAPLIPLLSLCHGRRLIAPDIGKHLLQILDFRRVVEGDARRIIFACPAAATSPS